VKVDDLLNLLLVDCEDAFSLFGEVVHHATADTFGVEFRDLSSSERAAVEGVINRLHRYTGI